jgi:hypothetical protein
MKPKTDFNVASAALRRGHRTESVLKRALWGLLLAAFGAASMIWLLGTFAFSNAGSEALAIVRERRSIREGEDVASAIEQAAGEILSPTALMSAMHKTADRNATDEVLAAAAKELQGRLRVDVDPGAGKQPWTISIRSASGEDAGLINVLAEDYCRARQSAAVAQQQAAYRAAQAATENARHSAEQSQQEFDRQLERLAERVGALSNRSAASESMAADLNPSLPAASELSPRKEELKGRIAELEAQRTSLLEKLLPAHPEVQEVDSEIEAAQSELQNLAVESPLAEPQADVPLQPEENETERLLAHLAARRKVLSHALAKASQLAVAEREASEQALRRRQDEIASMTPATLPAQPAARPGWQMLAPAGLIALLVILAAGRRRIAAADVFRDADELETALGIPLVGMLAG